MAGLVCNDPLARCIDGNLFRLNAEDTSGVVEGRVNGMSTGPLPHGERIILPNDLQGTRNALDLVVNGTTYPLIENLHDYSVTQPQDVGVLLSELPPGRSAGGTPATPDDVLLVQVPPALAGLSPGEQELDLSTADEATLQWVAVSILAALEQIDEVTGVEALRGATDGVIDLRMTGTDGAPFIVDMISILRTSNARQALRVISQSGGQKIKILVNGAGALMIAMRVRSSLGRQLAAGIAASLVRSRLANVVMGAKGQLGGNAAVQTGGRIPVIGFVIVGTINVIEWYANPTSRGDWSLLISTLFVDFGSLAIATLAGSAAVAGLVTLLGGALALTLGTAVLVAAAGIAVGLAVGVSLSWIANQTGAVQALDRVLTAVGGALSAVAQGAATVIGRFADRLDEVLQAIDDATYDPLEWAIDVDRGLNAIIQRRIDALIQNAIRR